ncbi:hypothetical protein AXG93_4032s1030 [Marchantia polymorpha subsp. ruderalis]|uniref:Uncharacterized protein n=1 Tax=Marchantia polymorpha subsp. ruderalis TaxID=1480154 RepID=A0A176WMS6_MARPO|nr:hypothetical protein AXG93_4032s1030 [Marchantia polymorpha subsp. ruderalis]
MAETDLTRLRTPKRRARPKKKANRKVVVSESLKGSVAMTERAASTTDEDMRIDGTVVESPEISSPQATEEVVRSKAEMKSSEQEPKELIVAFPNFLQDNVVPLLKYLDGKQEKYAISKESGFYVEIIRIRSRIKQPVAVKTAKKTKKKCAEATAKAA